MHISKIACSLVVLAAAASLPRAQTPQTSTPLRSFKEITAAQYEAAEKDYREAVTADFLTYLKPYTQRARVDFSITLISSIEEGRGFIFLYGRHIEPLRNGFYMRCVLTDRAGESLGTRYYETQGDLRPLGRKQHLSIQFGKGVKTRRAETTILLKQANQNGKKVILKLGQLDT